MDPHAESKKWPELKLTTSVDPQTKAVLQQSMRNASSGFNGWNFTKLYLWFFSWGSNSAASACPSWLVNGILQHRNLLNNTDAMQCDAISAASLQAPCNLCPGLTMTPDTKPESLLVAWRCCKRWEQNLNTACFLLARILHLLQKLKEIWI